MKYLEARLRNIFWDHKFLKVKNYSIVLQKENKNPCLNKI